MEGDDREVSEDGASPAPAMETGAVEADPTSTLLHDQEPAGDQAEADPPAPPPLHLPAGSVDLDDGTDLAAWPAEPLPAPAPPPPATGVGWPDGPADVMPSPPVGHAGSPARSSGGGHLLTTVGTVVAALAGLVAAIAGTVQLAGTRTGLFAVMITLSLLGLVASSWVLLAQDTVETGIHLVGTNDTHRYTRQRFEPKARAAAALGLLASVVVAVAAVLVRF